jgi:LPS-assembly lipoprotein
VISGSVDNFTSYSATGTTVATLAAERDAQERLMIQLADQIFVRLASAELS